MATGIRVTGLAELQRAFRKIDKDLSKDLRDSLKKAADPVAELAQTYALGRIRNMPRSPRWAADRVGVSAGAAVYVVPKAKRRGGSGRPNLKSQLQTKALDAALEAKQEEVVKAVDDMLGDLAGEAGF